MIKRMFKGRVCRRNYLIGSFAVSLPAMMIFISYFVLQLGEVTLGVELTNHSVIPYLYVFFGIPILFFLPIGLFSIIVRRHHDFNQSWPYPFFIIIGVILLRLINSTLAEWSQSLYALLLLFIKGNKGVNSFGPPDKNKNILQIIGWKKVYKRQTPPPY